MRTIRTKQLLVIAMALVLVLTLTSCSERTKMIGRWNIIKVASGEMEMDADELADMGLQSAGYIKLNKSGSCELDLLGDQFEGTWEMNDDGGITIKYGSDNEGAATKSGKTLNFTDAQGNEYELEK